MEKSRLNLLPEDCQRLIWKKVFDGCLETLPKNKILYFKTLDYQTEIQKYKQIQGDITIIKNGDVLIERKYDRMLGVYAHFYKVEKITDKSYKCKMLSYLTIRYNKLNYYQRAFLPFYYEFMNDEKIYYIKKDIINRARMYTITEKWNVDNMLDY